MNYRRAKIKVSKNTAAQEKCKVIKRGVLELRKQLKPFNNTKSILKLAAPQNRPGCSNRAKEYGIVDVFIRVIFRRIMNYGKF